MHNWIWHRDQNGNHFDLREDAAVPDGVTPVSKYPVHRGLTGRPGKARLEIRDEDRPSYGSMRLSELELEVDRRNEDAAATETPEVEVQGKPTVRNLAAALEAHDAAVAELLPVVEDPPEVEQSSDTTSGTGENTTTTTTTASTPGQESE